MDEKSKIGLFLQTFENLTKNAEDYVTGVNQEIKKNSEKDVRIFLKNVYDFVKSTEVEAPRSNALPELLIENFDEEQIWQEIELQNNDHLNRFSSEISRLKSVKNDIIFPLREAKKEKPVLESKQTKKDISSTAQNNSIEEDSENDDEFSNASITDEETNQSIKDNSKKKKKKNLIEGSTKEKQKASIVDDEFFKLSEMEKFLLAAEKDENNDYNSEDSEDEVDYFDDIPSDQEYGEEKKYKYNDFFATPHEASNSIPSDNVIDDIDDKDEGEIDNNENDLIDDDEEEADDGSEEGEDEEEGEFNKKVTFASENSENEFNDDEDDDKGNDDKDEESMETDSEFDIDFKKNSKLNNNSKSTMELREERLNKKIKELEEKGLSDKPWQMKGEISASARPQNSLLEEVLEYDMTARQAPVMTEATTERLEDIIIRRIKDKAWDDVERKVKPVENISEFKKRLVLDQEKSKESLAEIYEKEFIKQRDAATSVGLSTPEFKEPEEPPEHKKITSMMVSLFSKLDALSNYHYTPLPAAPEVKIVNNMPAITMEEVAPVTATDANLLAPEEVLGKKKQELISKDERTVTDRKRERRKKKKFQRVKKMRLEQKELLNKNKEQKFTKAKAFENLKKLSKFKNVKIVS